MKTDSINIRWLGFEAYQCTWQAMQAFTHQRDQETIDEIWLLEHQPVFTQGQNGKAEHLLNPGDIPVIQTDRGGQITYHGPGQLMVYTLIDLKRKKLNIREVVTLLEESVIQYLAGLGVRATAKREAPGVYVNEEKICSIGLRVRRGYAYHGIAFNVDMDLEPFSRINPCGYSDLKMTQLVTHTGPITVSEASQRLLAYLLKNFGYTTANYASNRNPQVDERTLD